MKEKETTKCLCEDSQCAKCLLINCKDENCKVHTKERKEKFRESYANRK